MGTTLRRESAPRHATAERIVVGPSLFTAISNPSEITRPRAVVRYVVPDGAVASLGAAACPTGVRDVVEDGLREREPDAVWLRDIPWFTAAWGVRATGRLERTLSTVLAGSGVEFVSWLEGADWLRDGANRTRRGQVASQLSR